MYLKKELLEIHKKLTNASSNLSRVTRTMRQSKLKLELMEINRTFKTAISKLEEIEMSVK